MTTLNLLEDKKRGEFVEKDLWGREQEAWTHSLNVGLRSEKINVATS